MPSYRLHYFPESGNSYKLALMLTLCGQQFEPVWTDFGGGVRQTAEWRRAQTAPILLKLASQYGRFGATRTGGRIRADALAVLGQSQADGRHGDLPLHARLHSIRRSACG